jgi:hypothetical protein
VAPRIKAAADLAARNKATGTIRVPEDFPAIKAALETAKEGPLIIYTTVLGAGEHRVEENEGGENCLTIDFPITIVGNGDKTEVVVVGGFQITCKEDVQGNVHIQNMTIRHLKGSGVFGKSPFALEDAIVEQCGCSGVYAQGTACVARCTNVEVRQCKYSGVAAFDGGLITLMGTKTAVHRNNTSGGYDEFGLRVFNAGSKIQLVHPLTKESVATKNQGGGNWGAGGGADINDIQTIPDFQPNKTYFLFFTCMQRVNVVCTCHMSWV